MGIIYLPPQAVQSPVLTTGQWVSTDNTTDINVTNAFVPLFGNETIPQPTDFLIINPISLQCLRDGAIRIWGCVPLIEQSGSNSRFNAEFTWNIGAFPIVDSPRFRSNYMRDANGHNETSQELTPFTANVSNGDVISLQVSRVSGTDGVVVLDGTVIEAKYVA